MAWLKVSWKQCPPPPLIVDCLRTMSEQPCASFESACLLDKAKGQNVWKYSLCFPLALSSTDKSHIKKLNWWLKLNVHRYFVASLWQCLEHDIGFQLTYLQYGPDWTYPTSSQDCWILWQGTSRICRAWFEGNDYSIVFHFGTVLCGKGMWNWRRIILDDLSALPGRTSTYSLSNSNLQELRTSSG